MFVDVDIAGASPFSPASTTFLPDILRTRNTFTSVSLSLQFPDSTVGQSRIPVSLSCAPSPILPLVDQLPAR